MNKALEEAWVKAKAALEDTADGPEGSAMKIWLAAEAAEYSSLLYSLTYGFEDEDPPPAGNKTEDKLSLVKDSVGCLRKMREAARLTHLETYRLLREAAHGLKTAYLSSLKNRKG